MGLIRLSITLFFTLNLVAASSAAAQTEYASIVLDVHDGRVLHAHQADAAREAAGLVKLLSAYAALDFVRRGEVGLADRVRISASAAARSVRDAPPLRVQERISFRTLLQRSLVSDADGAAIALAERTLGGPQNTMGALGAWARRLGLREHTFPDPARAPGMAMTARDAALIGRALVGEFADPILALLPDMIPVTDQTAGGAARVSVLMAVQSGDGFHGVYLVRGGQDAVVTVILGAPNARTRDAHARDLMMRALAVAAQATLAPPATDMSIRGAERPLALTAFSPSAPPSFRNNDEEDGDDQERVRIIVEGEEDNWAPPPSDEPPTSRQGVSFAVQVGAYAARGRSDQRLADVRRAWPRIFAGSVPLSTPADVNGAQIWRARFHDFDEAGAQDACAILKEAGEGCLVVRLSASDRAGLATRD